MNKKIALISAGVLAALIAVSYGVVGGALQPFLTSAATDTLPVPDSNTAPIDDVDFGAALAFDSITNATIPADIAEANNAFAVDFYKQVDTGYENIFFSPTSIYAASSLLYEGARYNTAEQIQKVFGINPDSEARHNATAHMISSINQDDPHTTLDIANSLWIANWFEPADSYLDVARNTYLTRTEKVDFFNGGVERINNWIVNKSHGKIPKLSESDLGSNTAIMLFNIIYFNGTWADPFLQSSTSESTFWKNTEQSVSADFMHKWQSRFAHAHLDDVQIVKLPYKGDRLSMLVVLPDDIDGMIQLRERLSPELIQKWTQNLYMGRLDISMPKFETKTRYDLIDVLKNLGMSDAFDQRQADLLGILGVSLGEKYAGNNLHVGQAIHSAYVKVNENGTEAAAGTQFALIFESKPPQFIADHPFMFIIQDDESGAILFMGAMYDPTA